MFVAYGPDVTNYLGTSRPLSSIVTQISVSLYCLIFLLGWRWDLKYLEVMASGWESLQGCPPLQCLYMLFARNRNNTRVKMDHPRSPSQEIPKWLLAHWPSRNTVGKKLPDVTSSLPLFPICIICSKSELWGVSWEEEEEVKLNSTWGIGVTGISFFTRSKKHS